MDHWHPFPDAPTRFALFRPPGSADPATGADSHHTTARATAAGAAWLASATPFPQRTLARWSERPGRPATLPCGTAFDVVSAPAVLGRRMADRLWSDGPGTGPVAVHRGRMLLFTAPGTARLLPVLLHRQQQEARERQEQEQEEGQRTGQGTGPGTGPWGAREVGVPAVPPLICHGFGDTVNVPPPMTPSCGPAAGLGTPAAHRDAYGVEAPYGDGDTHGTGATHGDRDAHGTGATYRSGETYGVGERHQGGETYESRFRACAPAGLSAASRWLVAPDVRHPWLPGGEVLLWACLRAARGSGDGGGRVRRAHRPAVVPC